MTPIEAISYAEYKFPDADGLEQIRIATAYFDGYIEAVKKMTETVKGIDND